jgi:hypothetical protein
VESEAILWSTTTEPLNILPGFGDIGNYKKDGSEVPDWVIYGLVILSGLIVEKACREKGILTFSFGTLFFVYQILSPRNKPNL